LDFVRIPKEPSIEDKRYARERIEEAYDLIAAGDSFDEIAVLYSDDQSTASKGGEMGWIAEGRLPPEADSVVFNLDVGQVSDIVEIHRAYHIFMVTDKREQSGRREVNLSQIMAIADTSPATIEMLADNAKDLTSAARDRGLDEAASEFEYTVEQADGVTLEVAARTLGVDQADMEKVFSTRPGKVMNPVEGRTAFYVIEVESASPAHIPAFEDALDDVRRAYVHDVETEKAREIAGEIASDVEKGSSLEAAAAARGLKVRSTEPFTRMTNVPGIGSVNEVTAHAFALETGQTAGPIENQGSFFIIRVDSRQSFDENQIAQQFDDLKLSAVMSKRQGFVGDWYNKARSKVKIEDYREAAY
jgi:peptidyl-prolyl cis-trans isomerase D